MARSEKADASLFQQVAARLLAFVPLSAGFYAALRILDSAGDDRWWIVCLLLLVFSWLSLLFSYYNPWVRSVLWELRYQVSVVPNCEKAEKKRWKKLKKKAKCEQDSPDTIHSPTKVVDPIPGFEVSKSEYQLHRHVGVVLEGFFALLACASLALFAYLIFPSASETLLSGNFVSIACAVALAAATIAVFGVCVNSPKEITTEVNRDPYIDKSQNRIEEVEKVRFLYYPYFVFCAAVSWCLVMLVMFFVAEALVDYRALNEFGERVKAARGDLAEIASEMSTNSGDSVPVNDLSPVVASASELRLAFYSYRSRMLTSSNRYLGGLACIMLLVFWALGTRYRHIYTQLVRDVVRLVAAACIFLLLPLVVIGSYVAVVYQGSQIRQCYSLVNDALVARVTEVDYDGEQLDLYHEIATETSELASVHGYYSGMVASWGGLAFILYSVVSAIGLRRADKRLWDVLKPQHISVLVQTCNWVRALLYVPKEKNEKPTQDGCT